MSLLTYYTLTQASLCSLYDVTTILNIACYLQSWGWFLQLLTAIRCSVIQTHRVKNTFTLQMEIIIHIKQNQLKARTTLSTKEWSSIQCNYTSNYKIAVIWFHNHKYDYWQTSDDTKSIYQLIIKIKVSEIKVGLTLLLTPSSLTFKSAGVVTVLASVCPNFLSIFSMYCFWWSWICFGSATLSVLVIVSLWPKSFSNVTSNVTSLRTNTFRFVSPNRRYPFDVKL